jgi:hypothetical protein
MMSLCLNLAKEIGFRPTETALKLVFDWLGIDATVPSFDSIRVWSCRVGIAQLKRPVRDGEQWIWLADHSNQIGQEKVLQIIGIRVKDLPPIGETLSRNQQFPAHGTAWTQTGRRGNLGKPTENEDESLSHRFCDIRSPAVGRRRCLRRPSRRNPIFTEYLRRPGSKHSLKAWTV